MNRPSPRRRWGRRLLPVVALAAAAGLAACTGGTGGDASGTATPTAEAVVPSGAVPSDAVPSGAAPAPSGPTTPGAVLPSALPSGAVMNGIAPGFPVDLIPEYPGSTVKSSVNTVHDGVRDVSISGQTGDASEKVHSFYADALKKGDFQELTSKKSGTVQSVTFSRSDGKEYLTVTTAGSGGQIVYTVGGQLTP